MCGANLDRAVKFVAYDYRFHADYVFKRVFRFEDVEEGRGKVQTSHPIVLEAARLHGCVVGAREAERLFTAGSGLVSRLSKRG